MSLEEKLKTKRIANEHAKLRINLLHTASHLKLRVKNFFGEYDLTLQQYNTLRILRGSLPESLSTKEINERLIEINADTSRVVTRLMRKDLVEKEISKTDKRMVEVRITPLGMDLLARIDKRIPVMNAWLEVLSLEEAEQMNEWLDRLREEA